MTTLTPSPNPSPQPPSASTTTTTETFVFPPHHSFPPFYTLQPNLTTQTRQLHLWSTIIQSYCHHHLIQKLSLSSALTLPLFSNTRIHRSLDLLTLRRILDFMSTPEGDSRVSWSHTLNPASNSKSDAEAKNMVYVWWRTQEEWSDAIYNWVEETGQKGSVLTVYELRESDAVKGQEWTGMDEVQFRRCVESLVKRGKAQIFGQADGAGVKFF